MQISKAQKGKVKQSVFFGLLGSVGVKVFCLMMVKLIPGANQTTKSS
jgi:hypothetical protein